MRLTSNSWATRLEIHTRFIPTFTHKEKEIGNNNFTFGLIPPRDFTPILSIGLQKVSSKMVLLLCTNLPTYYLTSSQITKTRFTFSGF